MTQDICIKISAPGKIILHGEHSVVYGKLAVAASLGLRTYIILKEQCTENGTKLLTINLKNLSLSLSFNIEDINKLLISFPKHSWNEPDLVDHESSLETIESFLKNSDRYPSLNNFHLISLKTILYLFTGILRSLDVLSESLDVTASTDLNIGAGTGSSASFNVGLAATFVQYLKEKLGIQPNKEEEVTTSGFTKSELEIISRWAFCAEKIIHGLPSGIDNTVCTFGNVVEFRKGTQPKLIELNSKLKVLLINTKVPRETKQLVLKVVKLRESDPIGTDKIMDELETIACEAIKNLLSLTDSSENKQYFDKLSQLCLENHKCLQQLGVSHPKLDEIVEMLSKYGLSGKLTGAGGGGYAISIIPSYIDGSIIDNLITTLEFCGFNAVLVDLGGIGVKIN